MSHQEASRQAILRWGPEGVAVQRRARQVESGLAPYAVGKSNGQLFEALGQGASWEEAFAQADEDGK
jgi:hypothetical protein